MSGSDERNTYSYPALAPREQNYRALLRQPKRQITAEDLARGKPYRSDDERRAMKKKS